MVAELEVDGPEGFEMTIAPPDVEALRWGDGDALGH
jgi:hypothetical protein